MMHTCPIFRSSLSLSFSPQPEPALTEVAPPTPTASLLSHAFDPTSLLCASTFSDGSVSIFSRPGPGSAFNLLCSVHAHLREASGAAWAHPQCFGRLLATFSAYETTIHLWQLEHGCVLAFQKSLPGGNRGVRDLSFAPVDQGPWLAAACADGIVRTYSPFDPVDHSTWEAGTRLPAAPPRGCCHSVTWAEPSTLQAPLLAVITTDQNGSRYAAHVFAHSRSFLRWISWCTLAEEVERTLQFVAFASNTSNASYERAAIGVGNWVYIMRLSEDAKEVAMADDENKASVQEIARIELEDEVEDASWSHDSMKLAVRTMCGSVAVYTQSLLDESEWRKVQSIA